MKAGMAVGVDRLIGILTAGIGVALIAASFATWARVSATHTEDGVSGSASLSFPGIGEPTFTLHVADGGTTVTGRIDDPALHTLHSSNPGWSALVLGVVAIIAGIVFLWSRQRMAASVAVAILGAIAGIFFISQMLDLAGTFDNPPGLNEKHFSPGVGLVGACALSFALTALGITTSVVQWQKRQ
ncbi:hypothetical protein ACRU13_19065 [Mycobacterium colombiense]